MFSPQPHSTCGDKFLYPVLACTTLQACAHPLQCVLCEVADSTSFKASRKDPPALTEKVHVSLMAYPLDFEAEKFTFCLRKILANVTDRLKPLVTGYTIFDITYNRNFFVLSKSKLEIILMFLYIISYCH